MPALLLSILTPLFLPFFLYFILVVPTREFLTKHSCMRSTFPIAILNGTCFFQQLNILNVFYFCVSVFTSDLSILMPLLSYSVSLSYFILAVLMRKCLGKHSFMSFTFPIAILNGTVLAFSWAKWSLLGPKLHLSKTMQYK